MSQTLFVRKKHIIIRIIHFCTETFFLCVISFCGKKFVKILWFCVPRALFSGQKSYAIYLVVLTLGVGVVMFSYEGAEV